MKYMNLIEKTFMIVKFDEWRCSPLIW